MKRRIAICLAIALVVALDALPATTDGAAPLAVAAAAAAAEKAPAPVKAPELKYSQKGTFEHWAEDTYSVTPVVADIDGDGALEVVTASYTISVLDAATGALKWRVNSGKDITSKFVEVGGGNGAMFADVEVADIDADGSPEIITTHSGGCISVLDKTGRFKPGWPQYLPAGVPNALAVADLDLDKTMEIVIGVGKADPVTARVYEHDGTERKGWPQLDPSQRDGVWSDGVFTDSISVGDIAGDGKLEILVPCDNPFMMVYDDGGKLVKANQKVFPGLFWAQIPFYEDYRAERKRENGGWGYNDVKGKSRADLYRAQLGHAGTTLADLDGNGSLEVLVVGIMTDRTEETLRPNPYYPPTLYMSLSVRNGDGTRWTNRKKGYDWQEIPKDLGAPLLQSHEILSCRVRTSPEVADLDGDGDPEILFPAYNGKLHCFSLDKEEHGSWPFAVTAPGSDMFEYASRPVAIDLNGDGKKEVIFTSWYDHTLDIKGKNASLYVVGHDGALLHKLELPPAKESVMNNGAMAKPVLADIDGDGLQELVVSTTFGGICAYDLSV
ncbi:MAG: VCBS repeat-containing protein [Clostridiales bacterium]|jgi:hypothetical protein|nr:VCBS repeat-containing protein [Clostridiales bacterium]